MRKVAVLLFVAFASAVMFAQDAVPGEMLSRTIFVKYGDEGGTAFAVDYKGKIYLVTARHVVANIPNKNATIQIYQENQWKDYHIVKTIYPSSDDVDIAVLETEEKVPARKTLRKCSLTEST